VRQAAATTAPDPLGEALLDLYLAHRRWDEDHRQCFARLGARTYITLLDDALRALSPDQSSRLGIQARAA
jgi:hypothetical protein